MRKKILDLSFGVAGLSGLVLLFLAGASHFRSIQYMWHDFARGPSPGSLGARNYYVTGASNGWFFFQWNADELTVPPSVAATKPLGAGWVGTMGPSRGWYTDVPIAVFSSYPNDHRWLVFDYRYHHDNGLPQGPFNMIHHNYLFRLRISLWAVVMGVIVIAAILGYRRRRWLSAYRQREKLCLNCGFDLRASPGRCPECGLEPSAASGR